MFLKISLVFCVYVASALALTCPSISVPIELPPMNASLYHYKIQITISDLNETLDGFEYYDHITNQTHLQIDQPGGSVKLVFDYNNNQVFSVDETNNNCTVKPMNETQDKLSLFGMGVENGPQHVKYAFVWGGNYTAIKMNETVYIDGIATDHFQTCLSFMDGNLTYFVDVYFSQSNWKMPAAQNAPVVLKLNATELNADNTTTSHLYTYKFSDYHTSKLPNVMLPAGIICKGRKDVPMLPPFNDTMGFTLGVHYHLDHVSYTGSFMEYYDYANKLFRMDDGNVNTIHNFKEGLAYIIYPQNQTCKVTAIPKDSPFLDVAPETVDNKSMVHMVNPAIFWKNLEPAYGGQIEVNHVLSNAWISQKPVEVPDLYFGGSKVYIYFTYYLSTLSTRYSTSFVGMDQKYISTINGTNQTYYFKSTVFENSENVSASDFDTTLCFNLSQQETVTFKFEYDVYTQFWKSPAAFKSAIVAATATAGNVSLYRVVPNVLYEVATELENGKNKTYFYVFVTLLGVPDVKGDSVEMEPQTSLANAVKLLKSVVTDNAFKVTGFNNEPVALPSYFKSVPELLTPKEAPPQPTPAPQTGFTAGVVGGVAVAMLVAGILLGCLVMVYRNRRAGSQYAYTMQD